MAPSIRRVDFGPQFPAAVTRVAAYARVSTGKDAMLHSLSAQVSYYSNMIQKHPGWLYWRSLHSFNNHFSIGRINTIRDNSF